MIEPSLDQLLTQVICRIAGIARLAEARAVSERKSKEELQQALKFRAKLMRQVDRRNLIFDA